MCAFVLVAEDDVKQADILRRYLEQEGHAVTVVHDGRAALEVARTRGPDLVVLDVMMPGLDGLDVCRLLRRESELPVLMLTARSTEDDLLLGLDLGADDYMTKPFSPRELMARVRTLLRRTRSAADDHVLRAGSLTVDPLRHEAFVDGRLVECTAGEFALLTALAEQPGRVFTRQQLLERTRGYDKFITERIIDVHVMNLRKKIEADPRRPARLLTVYRVGYKLADGGRDAP
ncbi:response regulator transcription factor [Crossiella sp. CA-258035]|uniref:response regulator transcription factor n=1 Tax=Crossiella sp. CA-258035 TaxID=2981138 RepID=UPI0024BCEC5A|nr:response regulator transcription factor [Crossiella sp. CA-258035]WHT16801.1 response regulator transcription factor [Crossiella sp. CA-258035]